MKSLSLKEKTFKLSEIKRHIDNFPKLSMGVREIIKHTHATHDLMHILIENKIVFRVDKKTPYVWDARIPITGKLTTTVYHKQNEYRKQFKSAKKANTPVVKPKIALGCTSTGQVNNVKPQMQKQLSILWGLFKYQW